MLDNASGCVEALVFRIRTTPKAFALLLSKVEPKGVEVELLLETVCLSFFEDLVNPETSELDLLQMLKEYVSKEVQNSQQCDDLFSDSSTSIAGRLLILYSQRRSQRRFIKQMLKQTLIRIINTDDRTLHLDEVRLTREVRANRRNFYGSRLSSVELDFSRMGKWVVDLETHSEDGMESVLDNVDEEVTALMNQMIETLKRYTLLILDAFYNNIESMPFSMRWLCRVVSNSILRRSTRNSLRDRNLTLGTWVFTRWILVSVQRADLNGLLWDTQVTESNIVNFGLIGRVIRHIYSETVFDERRFAVLNDFIQKEM